MMKNTRSMMLLITAVSGVTLTQAQAADKAANGQQVYRAQDLQSFTGPDNLFTGSVNVDMLFPENEVAHYSAAYVAFQAGARTA